MAEEIKLTPLEVRQAEVAQYEANIVLYESILATLPTAYPDNLLEYKNATDQHATVAKIENLEDVELLSKLWYADECRNAIRAETVEMTKAKAILSILQTAIE